MIKNSTNANIILHAQYGKDAQTTTGNMSTDSFRPGFTRHAAPHVGQLPKPWERVLNGMFRDGVISQVIYSYSTPIAWKVIGRGWIIPIETYSPTTSTRHQTHLWRLKGEHIYLPYDATEEDAMRVMAGIMEFTRDRSGRPASVKPGPRYATDKMLAVFARANKAA